MADIYNVTQAELNVSKTNTIHMPLNSNEFKAYRDEPDKLDDIFTVMIEPRALTKAEIDDMMSKGLSQGIKASDALYQSWG